MPSLRDRRGATARSPGPTTMAPLTRAISACHLTNTSPYQASCLRRCRHRVNRWSTDPTALRGSPTGFACVEHPPFLGFLDRDVLGGTRRADFLNLVSQVRILPGACGKQPGKEDLLSPGSESDEGPVARLISTSAHESMKWYFVTKRSLDQARGVMRPSISNIQFVGRPSCLRSLTLRGWCGLGIALDLDGQ